MSLDPEAVPTPTPKVKERQPRRRSMLQRLMGGKDKQAPVEEVVSDEERKDEEDIREGLFGRSPLPSELARRGFTGQGWDTVFQRLDHAGLQGTGFFNPAVYTREIELLNSDTLHPLKCHALRAELGRGADNLPTVMLRIKFERDEEDMMAMYGTKKSRSLLSFGGTGEIL